MMDPNFKRSVVLLVEHVDEATIGYVLGQQTDLYLKDILPDFAEAKFPVYLGGPVAKDTLHFIHRCNDRMNSGEEISGGLYWGGNFETLRLLIETNQIAENEILFFVGYSGWGVNQLDDELKQNSWLVSNNYNAELLFSQETESLWKEAVVGLGSKYAHIVNFPENPLLN